MYNTPILFNIFNRPDTTEKVLRQIQQLQPAVLYVHADGPRKGNTTDTEKSEQCKSLIRSMVIWDCDLHLMYETENKGCGIGPANAITWFFDNVEQGIILEDDCVPHPEFFQFAEEMLIRYKDDLRITSIAGSNFQDGHQRGDASYYFSQHNRIWGWATWRRVWKHYDYYMTNATPDAIEQLVNRCFDRKRDRQYWYKILSMVHDNRQNDSCWDYQFMYLQWKLKGLTVTPNQNLVSNIGDGADATHTHWKNDHNLNRTVTPIYPLRYTDNVVINRLADNYYMDLYIVHYKNIFQRIVRKVAKRIKQMVCVAKNIVIVFCL